MNLRENLSTKIPRAKTMQEKFVNIDGNKIRYLESEGSSETLVLIHGLGASAERWEFVAPSLKTGKSGE